jgi:hypothetical protein
VKTSLKLSAYGAALAALVAGMYLVGTAAGPMSDSSSPVSTAGHVDDGHGAAGSAPAAHEPGGLASTRDGYTLVPETTTIGTTTVGSGTFAFRITGPGDDPVTAFDVVHERQLHFIVVRRDGTDFQHVHPEMDASGTWRVPLTVPAAGVYRAFADFTPTGGPATTLGVDLFAPGDFRPTAHAPSRSAVVDGYTVTLDGDLRAGALSPLTLAVGRDGAPVVVQPYLGSYGHLVALRDGDLAYLHVHPRTDGAPGSAVRFDAEVPSTGTYRLFFDFQVDGVVRTADFTVATA